MNKDELKKKIVKILANCKCEECAVEYCADCEGNPCIENCREKQQADALIDANIFVDIDTLKDEQQSMNGILTNMSSYMKHKLHELKHRAEVAERALRNALNNDTCYFCNEKIHCRCEHRDWGSDECIKSLLQQAEKELA